MSLAISTISGDWPTICSTPLSSTVPGAAAGIRFFGDPEQPANFTACSAIAGYCDFSEPIPEDGEKSGNACNKNRGLSGAPNINVSSTLEGNTGQWLKIGGAWIYVNY